MKLRNKETGEIADWSYITFRDTSPNAKRGQCFASISQLNEKWEDYKPAEPLIKDEKIRKAVRAWAGFFYEESLRVVVNEDFISLFCDIEHYSASPEMDISPESFGGGVISDHYYTIAELCGEEEE